MVAPCDHKYMSKKSPKATDAYAAMVICAAIGRTDVTRKALADAGVHGYTKADIQEVVRTMRWKHHQYTVKSKDRLGTTQDVYHRKIKNIQWYIKVAIGSKNEKTKPWLIVTSFVERGKPHVVQPVSRKNRKNKKADKSRVSRRTT